MSWRLKQSHVGRKWQKESNPLLHPINPSNFLDRDCCAYSIGSCFAVNLNRWLQSQGFGVPPVSWGMHYNPRTILYELQRAVGQNVPEMDWIVTREDGSTAYVDALRHCIDAQSAGELRRIKAEIAQDSARAFAAADGFLITLGLSDVWEVERDGELITLNRAPYRDARTLEQLSSESATNRFLSVEECVVDLARIAEIIRTNRPGAPIILTVSPVPLKHSSNACHPHIANSRSKSTLLSAIFAFIDQDRGEPKISYFPSYEFFQSNPLGIELWQPDHRHPTAEAISCVAEAFVSAYSDSMIDIRPGFSVPIFGEGRILADSR